MTVRRTLWLAFALGAAVATGLAGAAPKPGWVRYYYGEDRTQVVGARGTDCDGAAVSWGVVTGDSVLIYTCID